MNIWEALAQVDGRKSLERRLEGKLGGLEVRRGNLGEKEEEEERMAVDLIELRVREVSNEFVVSRGRKLVYVGEPGLVSDGFVHLADRCGGTQHLDLSSQKLRREDLGRISRMSSLQTLVLDNCQLSEKDFGFLGSLPTVSTVSLNNNLITSLRPSIQVVGKSFPNLAILSLIGNPFHKELQAPVQVLHYRLEVISRISKLRILDHAAVNEEERRQARRGVRADDVGGGGGGKEKKQEESKGAREEMTAEEDLKTDGKEECDGLIGMERLQRQAGGSPQTNVESKGVQERTETAMEATEGQSGDHTTILTTSRRKSKGLRSEGNRFIQNCEL